MVESFQSVFKVIKRFSKFIDRIESEVQRKVIMDEILKYKVLLKELSIYMFKPICYNIFKVRIIFI
jgi:hypothetical protein